MPFTFKSINNQYMRSYKVLFELVKENKHLFATGLCPLINKMYQKDIITWEEADKLMLYIRKYTPIFWWFKYAPYCWEKGNWDIRLLWIDKQIKKHTHGE
jgi:hypothetical protein